MSTTQTLRRMYAISEGPCYGLVDGLKSVKLNGTPILAEDGTTFNFKNICVALVNGTKTQQSIKGFPDIETEFSVGSEITYSMPQYITVSDTSVNAVIVSITLPALQGIDQTTGKQIRKTVQLSIDVQASGGSYTAQTLYGDGKISDCASGSVAQSYEIPLDGTGPWTLRIKRLTADATDSYTQDKTYLGSYTQIKHAKLTNPWTAKMAISLNAEQFSSVPDVTLDYKGRIIKVPSNYDPSTRVCTGVWDGTFKDAWSDNPAWCFYDMATSVRYGAGRYLDENGIDIWMLYEIAQYCDVPVDNGQGGTEPRCTFNAYLSSDEECFKVLSHIVSVARAQLYYGASQDRPSTMLTAVQDAPGPVAALFSPSNVIGGKFTYSGTPRKTRYTEVTVWWNDPEQNYKLVPVLVVADASYIARYGVQSYETTAFGCTSKGQAVREGRRILYTNLLETGLLSFESGLEGMVICPGQLIQVKDPARDRERKGGRLKDGCTTTTLALDGDVTLASGTAYTAYVTLPNGKVESRGITTAAGTVSSVTLTSALSSTPQAESQWQIAPTATAPTVWRVLGVKEKKSESAISYEISAVQNAPEKYALIETIGTIPSTPEDPPVVFAPVTGLIVTANTAWAAGNSVITVQAAWTMPKDATGARAMIRIDTGAWQEMTVSGSSATFATTAARPVEVQVFAEYKRGTSVAATVSYTIPAITTTTPSSLSITQQSAFDGYTDADVGTGSSRIGGEPSDIVADYITATWTHTDANAFALKGFRVVLFTGTDPNNLDSYQCRPVEVGPAIRESTIRVFVVMSTTLNAAVQALYLDGNESSWRLASGGVVIDPDTITIATKDAVVAAQATATSAATSAATANSGLSTLNSDDILSCAKKPQAITDYNAEITTRAQLQAAAMACSPAVDHSAYTSAVDTLASFLGGLTPAWTDLTQDTPLGSGGGATLRSRWATIAQQRAALQVSISQAQATKASNDAISAAAQDASTKVNSALTQAANDATAKAAAQKQAAIDSINSSVAGMVSGATSAADAVSKVQTAAANAAANADTALARGFGSNLLTNVDWKTGLWAQEDYSPDVPKPTWGTNLNQDWALDSTLEATAYMCHASAGVSQWSTNYAQIDADLVTVTPGKRYIASVYSGARRCDVAIYLAFLDASGAWLGYVGDGSGPWRNAQEASGGKYLAGYKRIYAVMDAPAGAVKAYVFLRKFGTKPGYDDSYGFFVRPMLEEVPSSVSQPSPWAPSAVGFGAAQAAAQAYADLKKTEAQAYADGIVTAEEQRAINDATAKYNAAMAAAQTAQTTANAAQTMSTYASPAALPAASGFAPGYGPVLTLSDYSLWKVNAGATAWDRILFGAEGIFGKVTADQIDVTDTLRAAIVDAPHVKTRLLTVMSDATASGPGETVQIGGGAVRAKSISTQHLVVTSTGSALNEDPGCTDLSAWKGYDSSAQVVTISDGVSGATALRSPAGSQGVYLCTRPIPIDPAKQYRVRCRVRGAGGAEGRDFILSVQVLDANQNQVAHRESSLTWYPWWQAPGTGWTVAQGYIGASTDRPFQPGDKFVRIGGYWNYGGGSGYQEVQDLRIEEVTGGDLLVDGAITAQKLAATLAITGVIQSPNWIAGAYGAAPQGFKLSGYAFTTTYKDGSTNSNCYQELGGDANFGGYKVATVNDRVFQRFNRLANGRFVYSASPWTLTATYPQWVSSVSKTAGTGSLKTFQTAVTGSTSGTATQSFAMPVSTGTITLALVQGLQFSNNAGTVTSEIKAYITNAATGAETLVATWTTTSTASDYALTWTDRSVDISSLVSAGGDFGIRIVHTVTASATTGGVSGYIDEVAIIA